MTDISTEQVGHAIQSFLEENHQAKADKGEDYLPENWIAAKAIGFAEKLKFGTHTSRGVHPSSTGNNITFITSQALPAHLVGSQQIPPQIDASGNAADLPLTKFFAILVDANSNTTLQDLLLQNHPALHGVFDPDANLSDQYQHLFQQALRGENQAPQTDARNKQLLWPGSANAITDDDYLNLIPLHPSSLSHHLWQHISNTRKQQKTAKETATAYTRFHGLSILKLGGTKPQNVSSLNSKQKGENHLLPALPPRYTPPTQTHLTRAVVPSSITTCVTNVVKR